MMYTHNYILKPFQTGNNELKLVKAFDGFKMRLCKMEFYTNDY